MNVSTIISADSHVFEPVDLWDKRLDRKFRERGPRFVADYQGKPGTWFVCEGISPRSISSIAATGIPKEDLVKFTNVHHKDLRPGGWEPGARLKDQDIDGVSAEVLYATYAMQLYCMPDGELQEAAFNAYNEWLAEMCGAAPDRLVGLSLISVYDVDHAVKELTRWTKRGLRGAARYPENPMEVMLTLGEMLTSPLFDRHPRLRIVLAEADIGWLPWLLARVDRGHERYARQNSIHTELKPSEYFHRNVSASFIVDREGVFNREFIGVDNLMWSSDYPSHRLNVAGLAQEHRARLRGRVRGGSRQDDVHECGEALRFQDRGEEARACCGRSLVRRSGRPLRFSVLAHQHAEGRLASGARRPAPGRHEARCSILHDQPRRQVPCIL